MGRGFSRSSSARGGAGRAGGSVGGSSAPDIDFKRILARLVRYFGQTKDYWLDHGTLQDWREIWNRELIEQPPAEHFLADYFEYSPAVTGSEEPEDDAGEVTFDVSECET